MKNEQRKMKDSGIEWIGEIPNDWKTIKCKYVSELINGYAFDSNDLSIDEKYPVVRIGDIKNGVVDYKNSLKIADITDLKEYIVKQNDILLAMSGATVGKVGYNYEKVKAVINQRVGIIRSEMSKYLYYCLSMDCFIRYILLNANGSAQPNISARDYYNFIIPYTDVTHRNNICLCIEKEASNIEKLIELEYQQIEKLKEYKQSLITEVVTKGLDKNVEMKDSGVEWIGKIPKHFIMQRMKRIGNCRNGLTYSPDEMCGSNGVLVLRSSNIQNGRLVFEDNVYVNKTVKDDLIVKIGDILICSRNGSRNLIGKNAIIESDLKCSFGAFMMIFRSNYNSKYIYYILNSLIFNYYLGTYLTSTINQLTGSNFENMIIPFTNDKKEQKEIVNFLDNKSRIIEETINIKYKKIEKLNEYKKSLIYEYVTGKKEV